MGSDAFTHTYNTLRMSESRSLFDFYEKSFSAEYLGYDYPIGVWYFGAILMKVTGLDAFDFAVTFIILILIISLFIFFAYAQKLIHSAEISTLALVFFVSMPLFVLNLLIYSSRQFVMIFLLAIMYFTVQKFDIKTAIIMVPLVFGIVFSHTGTYIFLVMFSTTLFLASAIIWRKFDASMFYLAAISFFIYVFSVRAFPFILPQYVDKGRLILTISTWLSSLLKVTFVKEIGIIIYENLFVGNNYIYALFWTSMIFALGKLCIELHDSFRRLPLRRFHAIPLIGDIEHLSHGIAMTPIWVGLVQTLFSVPGFFKIDWRGKGITLALFAAAVLPGAMQSGGGTGSLREIYYLYLIIPITAAIGFYSIRLRLRRSLTLILYLIIFLTLIITPIIGNLHYQPDISGTKNEEENLLWLGGIGVPTEGAVPLYYRERINFYAHKLTPSVPSGSETRRFTTDLRNALFSPGSEWYTQDLYSYNIRYLIASEKIYGGFLKNYSDLKADTNKRLDKIYASDNHYGLYQYILDPVRPNPETQSGGGLNFIENTPAIQEFGPVFLIENDYYRMKLSRDSPQIRFIGTRTQNALGEGYMQDTVRISRPGDSGDTTVSLENIEYGDIIVDGNRLQYKALITIGKANERLGTLLVTYTFYQKAIKREIIFANDWMNTGESLGIDCRNTIFAPATEFQFNQITGAAKEKTMNKVVYPSMDMVLLKDRIFDQIYYKEDSTGLLRQFGDSAPYPSSISYRGSTLYDYTLVITSATSTVAPSEPMHLVEYFAIGDRATAEQHISSYTSISPYLFPDAQIPMVMVGFGDWYKAPDYTLSAQQIIEKSNLTYGEINPANLPAANSAIEPIGYASSKNPAVFASIKERLNTNGMAFNAFSYNLNAVGTLINQNYTFLLSKVVSPPYYELNREGVRNPKLAYYHGNETGLVLVPVTRPFSSIMGPLSDVSEAFSQWRETLDSVFIDGGMAVYFWDMDDIGNPEYTAQFLLFINKSESKGASISDLDTVAGHIQALRDVSVNATKGLDTVELEVENRNHAAIEGVTYFIQVPEIDGACPYSAVNGTISRRSRQTGTCNIFVTFNIQGLEKTKVTIQPDIERKQFSSVIPVLFEGSGKIIVRDSSGNIVPNAHLVIDGRVSISNAKGEAAFTVRRGTHTVKIEKPGYTPLEFQSDVKGRLLKLLSLLQ
ncbi:MAG: carboxypeptidase-like regulatory domain-containing protein [Methanomicrobiales archaeon]|nr:carboxypeptidase-like regulatory domain-containing protein [Methanomicrobiales archaeon]